MCFIDINLKVRLHSGQTSMKLVDFPLARYSKPLEIFESRLLPKHTKVAATAIFWRKAFGCKLCSPEGRNLEKTMFL